MTERRVLLCLLFTMFVSANAHAAFDPAAMRVKQVVGASFHVMGYAGADVRNVDGIPGDEVLIGYPSMWHLLQWDSKAQTFAQLGFYENGVGGTFGGGGLKSVQFAEVDVESGVEVAVLTDSSAIGMFRLDGSFLRTVWTPAVTGLVAMYFADLDGKPGDEVLLQTCSELTAWQFGSPTPLWRIRVEDCAAIAIAQLDFDPQLEIAMGSGLVFDSRTTQQEWRYPLRFGLTLTSGDVNGDGVRELIGCTGRQCDAFDVARKTTLWETFVPYPWDVGVIAAADVDFDGKAEIFAGDAQHGFIRKMSGATGQPLAQFEKLGGANFVLVGNLDGDCDLELIWAKDGNSTALDTLHVTDPVEMKTFWSSVPEDYGSSGVVVGDFPGTGHPEILWAGQAGSLARFVSLNAPARVSRIVNSRPDSYAMLLPIVTAAQLDPDPAVEYVLPMTETSIFGGREVAVYDGATDLLEWSLPVTEDTITSMTAGDLTGDGVPEIIIGSSILYFPRKHPQAVVAVDGASRSILWRTKEELSYLLDEDCLGCIVQVAISDLDLNGTKEVLALVPNDGLYAYDGRTGDLLWHRQGLSGAWAFTASDIDPSPGTEIIIPFYGKKRLAVFDSTGQSVIREKDLGQFGSGLSVQAVDLDSDGATEIVVVADGALLVLSAQTLDILWSGGRVLPWLSLGNQLAIADVDGDSTMEIVAPSAHSLHIFEYRPIKPDTFAPVFIDDKLRTATLNSCCGISLEWDPASDAASMPVTYRIYRSTQPNVIPGPSLLLGETARTTFLDRTLSGSQNYYYAVTAVDGAGNETNGPLLGSVVAPPSCGPTRHRAVRH